MKCEECVFKVKHDGEAKCAKFGYSIEMSEKLTGDNKSMGCPDGEGKKTLS